MAKSIVVAAIATPLVAVACHGSDSLPTDPPTKTSLVAKGGFTSPGDAVSSPDGAEFYFTGYLEDEDRTPAILHTSSAFRVRGM